MILTISSPTKAYLSSYTEEELDSLRKQLSFKDLSAQHELKRLSKNQWFKIQNPIKYKLHYDLLKSKIDQCLVFEEGGKYFIRPGSTSYLQGFDLQVINEVEYSKPRPTHFFRPLPYKLYDYQEQSVKKLLETKHANVSITTGGGKGSIILKLYKDTNFKTAVITPSRAIFNELVEKFEYHFGKSNIGKFGAGKKKLGKNITICVDDSLVNIEKDSEEWKFFNDINMLLWDESHTSASATLEKVNHEIFAETPYRFYFSGTQTRGDGGVKLLQSIIGETVYTLTTEEAVSDGFICPHNFKIIRIEPSNPNFTGTDPLEIKRECFLREKNIAHFIAKLAYVLKARNEQMLVMCEELSQIAILNKLIPSIGYAHSETNRDRLFGLGLEKVDVAEQIEKFNKNEIKVLCGTSCISVGVNIYPANHVVNWAGGASEVRTKQGAVGRAVRLASANPYKNLCSPKESVTIYDFDIVGNYVLEQHLKKRLEYYQDSGEGLIKYINFK